MEQRALKNVNNCLNNNIYSYLEKSGANPKNILQRQFTDFRNKLECLSLASLSNQAEVCR